MIIFANVRKSVDYKDFILLNVHPANYPNILIDDDVINACGFEYDMTHANYKVKIDDDIVTISIDFPSRSVKEIKVLGPKYRLNNIPYSNRGWYVLADLQDTIRELSGNELPIDEESLRKIILNQQSHEKVYHTPDLVAGSSDISFRSDN